MTRKDDVPLQGDTLPGDETRCRITPSSTAARHRDGNIKTPRQAQKRNGPLRWKKTGEAVAAKRAARPQILTAWFDAAAGPAHNSEYITLGTAKNKPAFDKFRAKVLVNNAGARECNRLVQAPCFNIYGRTGDCNTLSIAPDRRAVMRANGGFSIEAVNLLTNEPR
jgi:hypothetical protein